jgi:hypothetical protein
MKVEVGRKATGKSYSLIEKAVNTNGQIVVYTYNDMRFYEFMALQLGVKIRKPILLKDFYTLKNTQDTVFLFDFSTMFESIHRNSIISVETNEVKVLKRDEKTNKFSSETVLT